MCHVSVTSCVTCVLLWKLLICCPLRSIGFHRLPHYYEAVRLLLTLRHTLDLQNLAMRPPFSGDQQTSQVCKYYLVCSPRSIDPDGISPPSLYRLVLTACGIEDYLGFRSLYLTGLNRFTVSHCGSHTPMPTLKPHLAASAPRLSTDCSLRFVGQGLSPCCLTCTELVHPLSTIL